MTSKSTGPVQVGEAFTSAMTNPTSTMPAEPDVEQYDIEHRVFKLFPKLPTELRFKIWEEAQPKNRVVDLVFQENNPDESFSTAAQPVLLAVCRESRVETLRKYTLLSESMKSLSYHPRRPIYIDPTNEVLLIADDSVLLRVDPDRSVSLDTIVSWLNTDVLENLKDLGIGFWTLQEDFDIESYSTALLPLLKFSALEAIFAVISPESKQRQPYMDITSIYDAHFYIHPPLLAPKDEDSILNVYIPQHVRFGPTAPGKQSHFDELNVALGINAGDDRVSAITNVEVEIWNAVAEVGLVDPGWKKPQVYLVALEARGNPQDCKRARNEYGPPARVMILGREMLQVYRDVSMAGVICILNLVSRFDPLDLILVPILGLAIVGAIWPSKAICYVLDYLRTPMHT